MSSFGTIGLIGRVGSEQVLETLLHLRDLLRARGLRVLVETDIAEHLAPAASDTTKRMAEHMMSSMGSMAKGAAWDKAYIDAEVADHEEVLNNAKAAHDETQNAALKALIEKATPGVQKHLDRAKEIEKMLTPAT